MNFFSSDTVLEEVAGQPNFSGCYLEHESQQKHKISVNTSFAPDLLLFRQRLQEQR